MRRENRSGLAGVQLVIVFEMLSRLLPRKPRGTMNPAGLPWESFGFSLRKRSTAKLAGPPESATFCALRKAEGSAGRASGICFPTYAKMDH